MQEAYGAFLDESIDSYYPTLQVRPVNVSGVNFVRNTLDFWRGSVGYYDVRLVYEVI